MPGFFSVKTYFFGIIHCVSISKCIKTEHLYFKKKCNSTEKYWFNKKSSVAHRFYVFFDAASGESGEGMGENCEQSDAIWWWGMTKYILKTT